MDQSTRMRSPESSSVLPESLRERWAIASILVGALAVRLAYGPHLRDDAYITLRYAQHLANGLGFTFNSGETVLGTTTPLFTILLALLARLGIAPSTSAVAIGIVADLGVTYLLWHLGRSLASPATGLLASLTYSLLPPVVAYAVSGMETALYLFLILLSFQMVHDGRLSLTAASCALVVLTRPDGLLVPASIATILAWQTYQATPCGIRRTELLARTIAAVRAHRRAILVFAVPTATWASFAWLYFGSPVPQSMLAKWTLPSIGPFTSIYCFAAYFLDLGDRWFLPLTCLAIIGLVTDLRYRWSCRFLFGWCVLYTLAFMASNKFVSPLLPFEWYFLPLMLPYSLAISAGLLRLGRLIQTRRRGYWLRDRRMQSLAATFLIALGLFHLLQQRLTLDRFVGGRENLYHRLGTALVHRYGVTGDVVAAPEIGALGYSYPGPLLDLNGLVSPLAAGRDMSELLRSQQPPWLVSYDTFVPASLWQSPWFQQHYRPVVSIENWETRRLILFRWYPDADPERSRGPILGDRFELLGRHLSWDRTPRGLFLRVELVWRMRAQTSPPTTFSVQVLDNADRKLAQQDNEPQEGSRPTTTWARGDLVVDRYDISLAEAARQAAQWLTIAAYRVGKPEAGLSWQSAAGTVLGLRLYVPLPGVTSTSSSAGVTPCHATFADGIQLVGFAIRPHPIAPVLTLVWQVRAVPSDDQTVFVHVLDDAGHLIGQADGPPAGGKLPTSDWEPGDVVVDQRALPALTNARATRIQVGLYRSPAGPRLARTDAPTDSVTLVTDGVPTCS